MPMSPTQASMSPRVSPVHSAQSTDLPVVPESLRDTATKVAEAVSSPSSSPSNSPASRPHHTAECLFDELAKRGHVGKIEEVSDGEEAVEPEFSAIYEALAEAARKRDWDKMGQILEGEEFYALMAKYNLSPSQAGAAILVLLGQNWNAQSRGIFDSLTDLPAFPDIAAEDLPLAFDFSAEKPLPASKERLEFFNALMMLTATDDLSGASIHNLAQVAAWNGDWNVVNQLLSLPNAKNLYEFAGNSAIPSLRNLAYQAGQWKIYSQVSYQAAVKKCADGWNQLQPQRSSVSQKLSECGDWFYNHRKVIALTLLVGGPLFMAYLYAPLAPPVDPSSVIGTGTGLTLSTGTGIGTSISSTATAAPAVAAIVLDATTSTGIETAATAPEDTSTGPADPSSVASLDATDSATLPANIAATGPITA